MSRKGFKCGVDSRVSPSEGVQGAKPKIPILLPIGWRDRDFGQQGHLGFDLLDALLKLGRAVPEAGVVIEWPLCLSLVLEPFPRAVGLDFPSEVRSGLLVAPQI